MNTQTLVDADSLAHAMRDADLLVVDCRFELADPLAAAAAFERAHIPGAVYADLDRDLSDQSRPARLGRHPMPEAAAFSALLARWGWTPETFVVACDAAGGALAAARLWWLLRVCGSRRCAVLDGGIAAWTRAGHALDATPCSRPPTAVEVRYDDAQVVGTDVLLQALADPRTRLIDARAAARFRGENETMDALAGHIAGAVNRPFSDNFAADGCFKPASRLREEFEALLGTALPRDAIHSCGSGVTACHNLLAMEHAGLHGSRIYAPSWSGWINRVDPPST